ncbi:hypothetical protein D3C78_791790 [compost metagenome]
MASIKGIYFVERIQLEFPKKEWIRCRPNRCMCIRQRRPLGCYSVKKFNEPRYDHCRFRDVLSSINLTARIAGRYLKIEGLYIP